MIEARTLSDQALASVSSQIQLYLLHRCIVLSRPGYHKKILLNLSEVREGGKALYK